MIPVQYFFVLSALLFFIGVYGFCTRRNLVAMLISIELVLNAADLNSLCSTAFSSQDSWKVSSSHCSLSE